MSLVFVCILGYVVLQLAFGFLVARSVHSEEDYLLAGRSLGPALVTFSVFATWFGAETCIGATGKVFREGLSGASADPFGYSLCIIFMGAFFAATFYARRYTTLADLFRERFGVAAERFAVVLLVPTSVLWAGAQIRAFGQILSGASELQVEVAITVAALIVIVYTSLGGMLADAWSDFAQGLILILGLLALSVSYFWFAEGTGSLAAVPTERLGVFAGDQPWLVTAEAWAVPVLGSLFSQELIARVLSARSVSVARWGTLSGAAVYILVGLMPVLLGLCAAQHLGAVHEDKVLLTLAEAYLPTVLYVIFAGALVSAILSTVDTALLVSGSLLAHNLLIPLSSGEAVESSAVEVDAEEARKLWLNRACVVGAGLVAFGLALSSESVHELVQTASGFGSAGIVVAVLFGLYTRFGGPRACHASLAVGLAIYVWFAFLEAHFKAAPAGGEPEAFPYPFLASLAGALAIYLMVGLFETVEEPVADPSGAAADESADATPVPTA